MRSIAWQVITTLVINRQRQYSQTMNNQPLIGIVGPCGAGKSTLASGLVQLGYSVRHIAQEHSYVPTMWQRITKPDILIYLDVSYLNTLKRRSLDWTVEEYKEQLYRLRHAHQHADFYLDTNPLDQREVLSAVISWLLIKFPSAVG